MRSAVPCENDSQSNGVNEPAIRRHESTAGSEKLLRKMQELIWREAKRSNVETWWAQACLINGVDPATRKAA